MRDFPQIDEVAENCVVNVCQPRSNLLCAGYCMYSSSVIFGGHGRTNQTQKKRKQDEEVLAIETTTTTSSKAAARISLTPEL
jgi:hypothetical protein